VASGKLTVVEKSGPATENCSQISYIYKRVVTLVSQQGFGNIDEDSCFACVIARPTQPRN
jgi:hypothetical protein